MRRSFRRRWGVVLLVVVLGAAIASAQQSRITPAIPPEFIHMDFTPDLSLLDQSGQTISNRDWLGTYTLVYFGFTSCPDVCPTDLQRLGDAYDAMSESARAQWRFVFVTVDPARDTPTALAEYLKNFSGNILGLSGSPEALAAVRKNYRVFAERQGDPKAADYLINHTALFYLLKPDGTAWGVIRPQIAPTRLADILNALSTPRQ